MAQNTRARCPFCRTDNDLGARWTNNTFINNNGMNIPAFCSGCGNEFDATGGGNGVFDTGADGRLSLRAAVREARDALFADGPISTGDADELLTTLQSAPHGEKITTAASGRFPKLEQWARRNPLKAKLVEVTFAAVLAAALARATAPSPEPSPTPTPVVNVTVVVDSPTADEIERAIDVAMAKSAVEGWSASSRNQRPN